MALHNRLIRERAEIAVAAVDRKVPVRAAFLFGSQATGTADEHSDIDVAAFIENIGRLGLVGRVRLGVEIREQTGDDVELHLLPAESLDDPPLASFAAYVIHQGVPIWENRHVPE